MRIERLGVADVASLGGSRGAAAHVRALVPDGASVEMAVREIVQSVRAQGDAAVREYTRRFDTDGNEPKPLIVAPQELDAAIK
jgi:histidinol dehydrogenase